MLYITVFILLFLSELVYFKFADHFNIIDKPNLRSSHSSITLRGGGIIFFVGVLLFFLYRDFSYPWFFIGLTLMASISFLDDIFTLSNKIRLLIHFLAVLLLNYQLDVLQMDWYLLLIAFVLIVGVINAYNFMDGINGITAAYSLSVLGLLLIKNHEGSFVEADLLYFVSLSVLVFAFFNFRMKAKCFAGDVGSVSIAYILLFMLGLLISQTGNFIYVLFLAVYGVDAVWTIIGRFIRGENIFEAHRSHLYQYLANEARVNKLLVSFLYAAVQFIIGLITLNIAELSREVQIVYALLTVTCMSVLYLLFKSYIKKRYLLTPQINQNK